MTAKRTAGTSPRFGVIATTGYEPTLGRSTAVMAVGTLLSRITGAARTIALAGFGLTALADTYSTANNTPNMVYELVAGGVLSAVLVPLFVSLFRGRFERSDDGISAIVTLTAVVVLGAVAAVMAASPLVVWLFLNRPDEAMKRQVAAELLRFFAPQIGVYGFITVATAMLNAKRRFAAPMFAPILNNLVVIVVLVWARRVIGALVPKGNINTTASLRAVATDGPAKLLLGLGTTAGVVAMGLAMLPSLRGLGVRIRWHWEPRHPAVRELARLSGWTFGYVVCNQIALWFVTNTANRANGDFTAYTLAYATFFLLPHGVFAVSVMTGLQPALAEAFLDRRRGRFRRLLADGIRTVNAVMIPAAAGYLVLATPIVGIVRTGGLDAAQAGRVAGVLRTLAIGLPGFSLYLLLMNAFKAMRDTRSTFEINAAENAINIVLAGVFYRWGLGVKGLGLAFALAYLVSATIAFRRVSVRTRGLKIVAVVRSLVRVLVGTAAMAAATKLVSAGCEHLLRNGATGRLGRPALILEVGAAVGCGVTVYAVVGRLVGITELDALVTGLRRRARRS